MAINGGWQPDPAATSRLLAAARDAARAALAGDDLPQARAWMERAWRLCPSDATLTLDLALLLLRLDPLQALALLSGLAERQDHVVLLGALAAASLGAGQVAPAIEAAQSMLARHAGGPTHAALARRLAPLAGRPGWCALDGNGVVTVEAGPMGDWAGVRLALDGAALPAGRNALPPGWRGATRLEISLHGAPLLGSPIEIDRITRLEGMVESDAAGLRGWAWHPADPGRTPMLSIPGAAGHPTLRLQPRRPDPSLLPGVVLAAPRAFAIPATRLADAARPWRVLGPNGTPLPAPAAPPRAARAPARASASAERHWRTGASQAGAALLITHDRGGGVEYLVRARAVALRQAGQRPVLLRPAPGGCGLTDRPDAAPVLRYRLPAELDRLAALLATDKPTHVELHHRLGHAPAIFGLAARLGIPLDIWAHDYASLCPRISLVGETRRYCGEPDDPAFCDACATACGNEIEERISTAALRARSAAEFTAARRVIVPSADAARRLRRWFPAITPRIVALDNTSPPAARPAPAAPATICLLGALGPAKGVDMLLACARDAAQRRLDLRFVLVGHSTRDEALLQTGRVWVTGPYAEADCAGLLAAQGAQLGFIPSVWPESWSFALSHLWQAGLPCVAFDLGAPAERIRAAGHHGGTVLPFGLPPDAVNDALLRLVC